MAASPEFAAAVYAIVARIPHGRVTTYGRIAQAIGEPRAAREVGWALMNVPAESDLPCHRVVNREGRLTGGWAFGQPEIMRGLLLDEECRSSTPNRSIWNAASGIRPTTSGSRSNPHCFQSVDPPMLTDSMRRTRLDG